MALQDLCSGVLTNPECPSLNKWGFPLWGLKNGKDTQRSQICFGANKWSRLPEKLFAFSMYLLNGQLLSVRLLVSVCPSLGKVIGQQQPTFGSIALL